MSFANFLDEIDAADGPRVSVGGHIVPGVKRHTGQDKVYFVEADLNTEVNLAQLKRYREPNSVYGANPIWVSEVRFSEGLNTCWSRFVCTKELMHSFDSDDARANTAEKFRTLIEELEMAPPKNVSSMRRSEDIAIWRAMAALAPARLTGPFEEAFKRGDIRAYDIALALQVPEFYVPHVMDTEFPSVVKVLRDM